MPPAVPATRIRAGGAMQWRSLPDRGLRDCAGQPVDGQAHAARRRAGGFRWCRRWRRHWAGNVSRPPGPYSARCLRRSVRSRSGSRQRSWAGGLPTRKCGGQGRPGSALPCLRRAPGSGPAACRKARPAPRRGTAPIRARARKPRGTMRISSARIAKTTSSSSSVKPRCPARRPSARPNACCGCRHFRPPRRARRPPRARGFRRRRRARALVSVGPAPGVRGKPFP